MYFWYPNRSIGHVLFNWLFGLAYKFKHQMLVCAAVICWAFWISWYNIFFSTTVVQNVIYKYFTE